MSSFLKSTLISNRDATPKVLSDGFLAQGQLEEAQGAVYCGVDTAKSFYRCVSVPSNARLSELYYQTDAVGSSTGAVLDVAAFYPTVIPTGGGNFLAASLAGTLISSSAFATNLSANTANALTLATNQSLNYNIALQETPLWNVLGLTSDPGIYFDLGFAVRVATANAGYVGLKVRYQY